MPGEDEYQQGQQGVLPRGPTSQPFRGPHRRNRATGRVDVWVEGHGYLPEGDPRTLPAADATALSRANELVGISRNNAQLAEQFLGNNRVPGHRTGGGPGGGGWLDAGGETGGWAALPQNMWGIPLPVIANQTRQRMDGITSEMVRANMTPGSASTMNSYLEQLLARQQYPSTETYGDTNGDRILGMLVDNDEATAYVEAARQWSTQRRSLNDFAADWSQNHSARVRRESEARHTGRLRVRPITIVSTPQMLAELPPGTVYRTPQDATPRTVPRPRNAPAQQQGAAPQQPTPAHVQRLLAGQGTDQQFDEVYGAGAAARVRQQAAGRR